MKSLHEAPKMKELSTKLKKQRKNFHRILQKPIVNTLDPSPWIKKKKALGSTKSDQAPVSTEFTH